MSSVRRNNLLSVLSYIAVIAVGLALVISWIFGRFDKTATIASALNIVAQALAYIVVACYSFRYARAKGVWWLVAWVVAVVLIVVFLILGF